MVRLGEQHAEQGRRGRGRRRADSGRRPDPPVARVRREGSGHAASLGTDPWDFLRELGQDDGVTRPRLLLVEDDPDLRAMLTDLLTDDGYAVEAAADGQRGLHLGLTGSFDVLLLDRRLPVVDGIDLLTVLRTRGVTAPVLMLSALAHPGDRVAGLDAGAEDYLAKPFDVDELLARLRALRRRHLDTARSLPVGTARLDLDTRQVHPADPSAQAVRLSDRECTLLATGLGRAGPPRRPRDRAQPAGRGCGVPADPARSVITR
jgi:two-component system response regulator QseB